MGMPMCCPVGPLGRMLRGHPEDRRLYRQRLYRARYTGRLATGVAGLAVGNPASALRRHSPCGSLLSLVGMEGGGFHLKGESTDGKTTVMKAAASVYGYPDRYSQTWRATGNAIEGIASRRNDAPSAWMNWASWTAGKQDRLPTCWPTAKARAAASRMVS